MKLAAMAWIHVAVVVLDIPSYRRLQKYCAVSVLSLLALNILTLNFRPVRMDAVSVRRSHLPESVVVTVVALFDTPALALHFAAAAMVTAAAGGAAAPPAVAVVMVAMMMPCLN